MIPQSPFAVFVSVVICVALFGGIITQYRLSATRYHLPVLLLAFFTVTISSTAFILAVTVDRSAYLSGLAVAFYLLVGVFVLAPLSVVSVVSWQLNLFKLPAAVLAGVFSIIGLLLLDVRYPATSPGLRQSLGLVGSVILLAWLSLAAVEKSMGINFSERMNS